MCLRAGARSLLQTGGGRSPSSLDSKAVDQMRPTRGDRWAVQEKSWVRLHCMAHILVRSSHCARGDGRSGVERGCVWEQAVRPFTFSLIQKAPRSWRRAVHARALNAVADAVSQNLVDWSLVV